MKAFFSWFGPRKTPLAHVLGLKRALYHVFELPGKQSIMFLKSQKGRLLWFANQQDTIASIWLQRRHFSKHLAPKGVL